MSENSYAEWRRIFFVIIIAGLAGCEPKGKKDLMFYRVASSHTGIDFENTLTNSDDFNIIEYLYFYNGAGVATGDINNDGLPDVFFSSNQGDNQLYLNKGDLQFENITSKSGVAGAGNWKTGVTMADVNGDGLLDIFVCGVGNYKKFDGRNQLFINNGDLTFTDKTDDYGLTFKGFSTQASFFDYDNDGDLDMYLANHAVHTARSYGHSMLRYQSDPLSGDKLYQNELVPTGRPHYNEVTSKAGILNSQIGYGLAVGVSDVNLDGYMDIYVSNDFNENDYLYINQRNGTFVQQLEKSIPHTSRFSMGNDIADINNDGRPEIVTLDMLPKDEGVIKTTAGEDSYDIYEFKLRYGYHFQFARNALQLNRGVAPDGSVMFSDIAPAAGIEATDWSWGPLFADFDNDGKKDLFISNGIVGRPNDLDYINYISSDSAQRYYTDQQLIDQMPAGDVPNEFFQNNGDLTFTRVSSQWLGDESSLSNGAAYADLDNDGDLDLVVNNINKKAYVYRNDLPAGSTNFIKVRLVGSGANPFGVGTRIAVYAGKDKFFHEQVPTRGWLSSVDYITHVGLGKYEKIDSVVVRWPNNKTQSMKSVKSNQVLVFRQDQANGESPNDKRKLNTTLLVERTTVNYKHRENTFIAFSIERLIPHMLSTQGPKISVADINHDNLDDFFVGGGSGQQGEIFIQDSHGNFKPSLQPAIAADSSAEDTGSAFFDANGDSFPDLVIVSGGQEFTAPDKKLKPRLYLNDGKGEFRKTEDNLPPIFVNASCVVPGDADNDGDTDLFIGGRVTGGKYGTDPPSFILINDGKGKFSDETARMLPGHGTERSLGMVSDALWADLNNDSLPELIVVGEWMPVTILMQNDSGVLENRTTAFGLSATNGWWSTIATHDFDGDGDLDFVVGNVGLNSRLRASEKEPVSLYIGDIDNNNSIDHILTYFNQGKQYPFVSRDQLIKQVPALKRKFLKFSNYRNVTLEDVIPASLRQDFIRKDAYTFASVYIANVGNGKFSVKALPVDAQFSPVYSFCITDINGDGHDDVLAAGNLDAVQPEIGRYDSGYGSVLLGDGKGNFKSLGADSSGFVVRGEARDIKVVTDKGGRRIFLVSRNNGSLTFFQRTNR